MCHGRGVQRTELHFHLLPGVDDGPADLAGSVELARLAVADGTGLVTATPHVRSLLAHDRLGELPARVAEVVGALRAAAVPLAVRTGAELAHEDLPALADADLEAIAQGPPGRRWVLIEAPLFGDDPAGFLAATGELRARGFGTLIGHPERCAALMEAPGAIEAELAAGARLQVNGSSLTGYHGPLTQARGIALVREEQVAAIASDAHRPGRGPVLSAALAALAAVGIRAAEALVAERPRALLAEGIPALPRPARAAAA